MQAVSSKSKEADGVTAVPDPPAPEEAEAPAEPAEEEGEEDAEAKAAAAAAAAEAAAKMPKPARRPEEFLQKEGIVLEMAVLPPVSRCYRADPCVCSIGCATLSCAESCQAA